MRVAGASILAAVLVAVLSTGCKSGMAPEECTGTCIVVENRSASQTIEFVNFSSCSDQSWGSDRLTGSLDPGEQRAWVGGAGLLGHSRWLGVGRHNLFEFGFRRGYHQWADVCADVQRLPVEPRRGRRRAESSKGPKGAPPGPAPGTARRARPRTTPQNGGPCGDSPPATPAAV